MASTTTGALPSAPPSGRGRVLAAVAVAGVGALLWWEAGPVPGVIALAAGAAWLVGWQSARTSRWRVVDIVVAGVLGVACGLLFWAWDIAWKPLGDALAFFPPLRAAGAGVWLVAGVLGGLVVRRPGAAVFTELVAATVEALIGTVWGFSTVWYGLLEGLGAEVVVALLLYRRWGLPTAVAAGAGAGVVVGLLDSFVYYPEFSASYKLVYLVVAVVSGAVIAGVGSWALTRALAATGALSPLASGRAAERV